MPGDRVSHPRPRVRPPKRERTRVRLIESALEVFARGQAGSVIQEVIRRADVTRATFYNHFRSEQELFGAVSEELASELIALQASARQAVDPARRIASCVRLYLRVAREYPLVARFATLPGPHAATPTWRIHGLLPADLADGHRTGRFARMSTEAALDLVAGATQAGLERIAGGTAPPDHPESIAAAILRGLGVPAGQAGRLAVVELPQFLVPPDSLLARVRGFG